MAPFVQLQYPAAIEATTHAPRTANISRRVPWLFELGQSVKMSELAKERKALVNLLARRFLKAFGSEALAGK